MKNCSCATTSGPLLTTRAVSAQAAMNVPRLTRNVQFGAQRRAPKTPRTSAPQQRECRAAGRSPPSLLRAGGRRGERLAFPEGFEMM